MRMLSTSACLQMLEAFSWASVDTVDTYYTLSELDAGFQYQCRVAAVNAAGQGAMSLPSDAFQPEATAQPTEPAVVKPLSNLKLYK